MVLLVVQRGHVPRTTGATGAPGEQDFATAAAAEVKAHVRPLGHRVRIIDADEPTSRYEGDFFVSLHYDSSTSSSARGASVGYQTDEGRSFAEAWKKHYRANGWSGGFRGDNYTGALAGYYGVRRAVSAGNTAAFIAEAGFGSSPADAALLKAPDGPDRVGRAVAAALVDILGCNCPPSSNPSPTPPSTSVPPFPGTVRRGSRGKAVREVQQRLRDRGWRITVDGIYGPKTEATVKAFQREKGIGVDGIAGPETWRTLWTAPVS